MKNTLCIKRMVDKLGRVTLPIDMRRMLNIDIGDPVYISFDGKVINVFKHDASALKASIGCVLENAYDSYDLTSSEFEELTRLLDKLGGNNE
jgi:bifunctional DNA-binding transcriptional regulator/antitoxin component of YhaV-PrlF toxin-antitoxin module